MDSVPCQCRCLIIPNVPVGRRLEALDAGKGKPSGFRIRIPSQDIQDNAQVTVQAVTGGDSRQPEGRTQNRPRSLVREESSGKLWKNSGKVQVYP